MSSTSLLPSVRSACFWCIVMNSDVIRQLVGRRPFEPFTMHLSGGETYEVRHPETVAIGKERVVVVNPESDQMAICSLLHVTSVETLQSA